MGEGVLWARACSFQKREAIIIDYFLRFNSEAAAITAAEGTALGKRIEGVWSWNTHFVLPDVKAWLISQDNPDGTHNYLSGWMCLVATKNVNQTLKNHPNLQFALDRDGPPYVIDNNIGAAMQDTGVQPIFCGSHYPMGGA